MSAEFEILNPLIGGALLGVSAAMLLYFAGRIFGVSGILGALLGFDVKQDLWRLFVVAGLVTGGLFLLWSGFDAFEFRLERSALVLILSGVLVGFGTQLGSGCTSGHGICGTSRFSTRSIAAVLSFMVTGVIGATLARLVWGG